MDSDAKKRKTAIPTLDHCCLKLCQKELADKEKEVDMVQTVVV